MDKRIEELAMRIADLKVAIMSRRQDEDFVLRAQHQIAAYRARLEHLCTMREAAERLGVIQ